MKAKELIKEFLDQTYFFLGVLVDRLEEEKASRKEAKEVLDGLRIGTRDRSFIYEQLELRGCIKWN